VKPKVLVLAQFAYVAQPLRHHPASGGRNIDSNPLAAEVLRGHQRCSAPVEGIENNVVWPRRDFENTLQQLQRLLGWIAQALLGL
jgi:hypothetical protein